MPAVVALGFGGGDGTDQIGIEGLLPAQVLLKQVEISALGRTAFTTPPGLPRLSHQPGVMAGALTGVQLLGQESELLTTPGGTSTRHAGVLVPVKGALDGAQELGLAQMIPKRSQADAADAIQSELLRRP